MSYNNSQWTREQGRVGLAQGREGWVTKAAGTISWWDCCSAGFNQELLQLPERTGREMWLPSSQPRHLCTEGLAPHSLALGIHSPKVLLFTGVQYDFSYQITAVWSRLCLCCVLGCFVKFVLWSRRCDANIQIILRLSHQMCLQHSGLKTS